MRFRDLLRTEARLGENSTSTPRKLHGAASEQRAMARALECVLDRKRGCRTQAYPIGPHSWLDLATARFARHHPVVLNRPECNLRVRDGGGRLQGPAQACRGHDAG